MGDIEDEIWIDMPEKTAENLSFLSEYFLVEHGNVKPKHELRKLDDEHKVLMSVAMGELRNINSETEGFEAVEIGEVIDAINDETQELEWNYYATLRSLEQDGSVIRTNDGEYQLHPQKFKSIRDSF